MNQVVEDHQQRALSQESDIKPENNITNTEKESKIILSQQGSEDPAGAENLQRCEELLPGTVSILFNRHWAIIDNILVIIVASPSF